VAGSFARGRRGEEGRGSAVRLHGSADWDEAWNRIVNRVPEFGLVLVRLNVNAPALGEGYHACWTSSPAGPEEERVWRAELPLAAHGHCIGRLEVAGRHDGEPAWRRLSALADLVQDFEATVSSLVDGARGQGAYNGNGRHAPADEPAGGPADQETPPPERRRGAAGVPALGMDATAR
jgi:hypothetical protein